MISRCHSQKDKQYPDYGGRGIYVCDEWRNDIALFIKWSLENDSAVGLQLDRTDNNGPYAPWNCRYVTAQVNSLNKRSNIWIEAFSERKTLSQWIKDPRCVVKDQRTLRRRVIEFGWIPEEAITLKSRKTRTRKCPQGHLLTEETTYQRGNGYRVCIECAKMQQQRAYYKDTLALKFPLYELSNQSMIRSGEWMILPEWWQFHKRANSQMPDKQQLEHLHRMYIEAGHIEPQFAQIAHVVNTLLLNTEIKHLDLLPDLI